LLVLAVTCFDPVRKIDGAFAMKVCGFLHQGVGGVVSSFLLGGGSSFLDIGIGCMAFDLCDPYGGWPFGKGCSPDRLPDVAVSLHLPMETFRLSDFSRDFEGSTRVVAKVLLIVSLAA